MQTSQLIFEAEKILKQRNIAIFIAAILLFINLLLAFVIISTDKEIVLVPNFLEQPSIISKQKASKQYTEALTRDIVNLMLNVTPENTDYIEKNILQITHPKFYGQLKVALNARSKDIISRRISTYFLPKTMTVEEKGVYVIGNLATFLGKEEVSSEEKTYFIEYSFEGFRPLLVGFAEIVKNDKN